MKRYTLGFIFTKDLKKVLLMRKTKPAWQAGRLNGVGGKIEPGEDAVTCIAREVEEETNLRIPKEAFRLVGCFHGQEWSMDVFSHAYQGDGQDAISREAEPVDWFSVEPLPDTVIPNLRWMIPFALEQLSTGQGQALESGRLGSFEIELL